MAAESSVNDAIDEERVRIELVKLAGELQRAKNPRHADEIFRLADKWLDERLEQTGAHKASCGCDECRVVVARFDPEIASIEEWGPCGTT